MKAHERMGNLQISRPHQSYLRGDRVRVQLPATEPTHCFCGKRALYRTNFGNEGRCRAHRGVKGEQRAGDEVI